MIQNQLQKNCIEFDDLMENDFANSKITYCMINRQNINYKEGEKTLNYTDVIRRIFIESNIEEIKKHTTLKITSKLDTSYTWISELSIGFRRRSSNEMLSEIIHLCECLKFEICIKITLDNDKKLKYYENFC